MRLVRIIGVMLLATLAFWVAFVVIAGAMAQMEVSSVRYNGKLVFVGNSYISVIERMGRPDYIRTAVLDKQIVEWYTYERKHHNTRCIIKIVGAQVVTITIEWKK